MSVGVLFWFIFFSDKIEKESVLVHIFLRGCFDHTFLICIIEMTTYIPSVAWEL